MPGRAMSLRTRALAMLARREHTRAEMRRKLATFAESPEDVDRLLEELERKGWLSEARFAESRAHQLGRKFGSRRIEYDLKRRGVPDELVAQALARAGADELERCRNAWQKKFGALPAGAEERRRQQRFLAGRGFSAEVVSLVLKTGELDG